MHRFSSVASHTAKLAARPVGLCFKSFVATRNNSSSPLERYKAKLEQKAKELGVLSVDQLQEKLKEEINEKKKEFNKMDPLAELEEYERRQQEEVAREKSDPLKSKTPRSPIDKATPQLPYKTLLSFLDTEKIKKLPSKDIEFLWKARFLNNERSLNASLSDVQFAGIYATAFKNPSFILPLPKEGQDGYEMHFIQWSFVGPQTTHCMLTTVAEYKLHKEYAKPHTTLMFHQELAEDKKLVLMNGQVETDSNLTMDEAQMLVLNVQRFYGGVGAAENVKTRASLLKSFTDGQENFDVETLIKEATTTD